MTRVYAKMGDGRYDLYAKGHATGSEQGCAFISGILYALAGYLTNAAESGHAEVDTMQLDPGDVVLRARGGKRVEAAYDMAIIGLFQLEKQRPELVQIEISEK